MHKLLARQLRRCFGSTEAIAGGLSSDGAEASLRKFIDTVDATYRQSDDDRLLLEHSMETVSQELIQGFGRLREALAESRRTEEALGETLALLSATIEGTTDGILVVGRDCRIAVSNRIFAEIWRLGDELLAAREAGVVLRAMLEQLETPEEFRSVVRSLADDPVSHAHGVLRLKDGRTCEHYSKPQIVGGVTVGRVWCFRDVTRRHALEEELRQAQKMEAVGGLAGGVAHDFNNLLTIIKGNAELLRDEVGSSLQPLAFLDEVILAADRAAILTRQLLAFSRKEVLRPSTLDLNEVVTSLGSMLGRLIGEDIEVAMDLRAAPGAVRADRGQLEQVLINLAVNARDAMPRGGRLTIRTTNAAITEVAHVRLEVSDTGVGIPRALWDRIFEPFFTTKAPGKGTGMGLATVYSIVRQTGGQIRVDSTERLGTTFTIDLPQSSATPSAHPTPPVTPDDETRGTETILLAEDEEGVRILAQRTLERRGYVVLVATNGANALRLAEEFSGRIDLVLTDVVMPELGGRALVERVRVRRPEVRVLYVSGYTDDEILRRGGLHHGTSFLQKPFTGADLATAVRRALDRTLEGAASSK